MRAGGLPFGGDREALTPPARGSRTRFNTPGRIETWVSGLVVESATGVAACVARAPFGTVPSTVTWSLESQPSVGLGRRMSVHETLTHVSSCISHGIDEHIRMRIEAI